MEESKGHPRRMEGSQVVVLLIYVCLEVLFCGIVTVQFGHFPEEEGIAFIPQVCICIHIQVV